jgi:hypothetical protein
MLFEPNQNRGQNGHDWVDRKLCDSDWYRRKTIIKPK